MSPTMKMVLGAVLGYAGYMVYKKLQRTQTVIVDSLDQPIPNIVGGGFNPQMPQYMMTDQIAGMGACRPCRSGNVRFQRTWSPEATQPDRYGSRR